MPEEKEESQIIPCNGTKTKDWYSWINRMPPKPDDFHVVGEVLVSNPGVEPMLVPKEPQGTNPQTLLLDLFLHQKPGVWPRIMVWKPVRYDKMSNVNYSNVEVFCDNSILAKMEVEEVH
ncbi:hypothetical protein [Aureibaculum conchae]|uniref:hypothetical protein n=1 Tax=Aureibaculum sp. 2308TA14-22 TaxID=3108392 RepID=UPI003393764B